jgi:hypothetical protein
MRFLFLAVFREFKSENIFECDFEKDWCGLVDLDGDFTLDENVGKTHTTLTGPLSDHTKGVENNEGYYIYRTGFNIDLLLS